MLSNLIFGKTPLIRSDLLLYAGVTTCTKITYPRSHRLIGACHKGYSLYYFIISIKQSFILTTIILLYFNICLNNHIHKLLAYSYRKESNINL